MDHILDLISESRLVLVAPELWDDPYENLLHRHTTLEHDPGSGFVMRWYGGDLFGSCWTWIPESDFAWRVYVPKGETGVIVETTVGKLLSAVAAWGGLYAARDCFVGEVQYLPGEEILATITSESFRRSNDSSDTAHMRALGLLLKRPEFEHEREVRVIVECADRQRRRELNLVDIPVDPNDLLSGIKVDPRIEATVCEAVIRELRDAGYEGYIRQSVLYRLPWEKDGVG